ncbi:LSM domain protein [Oesophagostomum dentatum]|uniref:Sm protein G n=1 Tax=Oesophagostomum dentatum TaxID=61180 RepID=A0A0B1SNT9_OESDE|nr:LSM domain protein [Oesophagostomum dentatum]
MSKTHPPELKKYMDKEMDLKLNGNRRVSGVLRGFDPFMNMVIEQIFDYHGIVTDGLCKVDMLWG